MNAAAWIALAGAIIVVATNVVVITRFLTKMEGQLAVSEGRLEGRLTLFRAEIEGSLNVMRLEHKNLMESTNADKGRLQMDHQRFERRVDVRLEGIERITGKAKMWTQESD